MPPKTAWEWIEAYGAVNLDKEKAHSTNYSEAIMEAQKILGEVCPMQKLENMLAETKNMALGKADEVLLPGSGWGALENMRK